MKITSSSEKNYVPDIGFNKTDTHIKDWTIDGINSLDKNENSKIDENKNVTAAKKILTTDEISTLHLLFGSNKPDEMSFYGQNKVQQINTGQFVDLFG
ncbi:MAG: hypothetical protein HN356_15260 [Calditrichaeota bacterium]|jgi:hypothetical protein|nr:hypothetical protein [Calditrichota bacterium]MBT7789755.1 hypothetical protein [Calditrichota bacterium]